MLVGIFVLSVGFRVMRGAHALCDVVVVAEVHKFFGCEFGISVTDNVFWHTPIGIYIMYKQYAQFFCIGFFPY